MAEAFGIFTGVLGLLEVAAETSTALRKIYGQI